jgi:hypothetical protein
LLAILVWACWVGRAFFTFDPSQIVPGGEFGQIISSHFAWQYLARCGSCVLWNGTNGGYPTLVDVLGSPAHPLIILTTLLWGAAFGAQIALVACLALAGLAQWWLAHTLHLGRLARLWSTALAVAGPGLAGRLDNGDVDVVLSTASCSLVLAAALDLALTGRRRVTVALAVLLALAIVSGAGYLQIGLAVGVAPALLVLLVGRGGRLRPVWREFGLAGLLALLLAGGFLVPLLHFWPHFGKGVDSSFSSAQPLDYSPLNLVIHDMSFYQTNQSLGKVVGPYLYVTYIGWLPVLLAVAAIRLVPRAQGHILAFFLVAVGLVYAASSALTFRLAQPLLPDFIDGIRDPSLIAGLAVPLVLALGAWGLDRLLRLNWPQVHLDWRSPDGHSRSSPLLSTWLLCLVPLVASVNDVYAFDQPFLHPVPLPSDAVGPGLRALHTPTTEWVAPPYEEHFWEPAALGSGLKLASVVLPFYWKDRSNPQPYRAISGSPPAQVSGQAKIQMTRLGSYPFYLATDPAAEYAEVVGAGRPVPCRATAFGGNIDVTCTTTAAGRLIVKEHVWDGWTAQIDRRSVALGQGDWLSVAAPAGNHRYTFRYRPWDVPVGVTLTLIGIALCIWFLLADRRHVRAGSSSGITVPELQHLT